MMRLSGSWITGTATRAVTRMLAEGGHRVMFVGGCVRNALLGVPIADIDIATDARPERVIALAKAADLRAVPTGAGHGTVTVIADGTGYQITTFRRDIGTDGRRAIVAYTGRIGQDARRRDFTINALYAGIDGTIVDPLGGLADLTARRVRFVGDPQQRIREDYLRILRFFRFHAWYGDPAQGLDADGLAAVAANLDGLVGLSRERIGHEMLKLLAAPDPAPAVAAMQAGGVLSALLPGADSAALQVLAGLEGDAPPEPIRRLAALGGNDVTGALRLSRKEAKVLAQLRDAACSGVGAAELGYRLGFAAGRDAIMLRAVLSGTPLQPGDLCAAAQGAAAEFPLKAQDFMPDLSGPALGRALAAARRRWIASGFRLDRDELLGQKCRVRG